MSFKDQLEKDLDVFQNINEYSEEHLIEGETVTCMIDSDIVAARSGTTADGIYENTVRLYVKESDLDDAGISERGYGDILTIDHRDYTVLNWTSNLGMISIDMAEALAE